VPSLSSFIRRFVYDPTHTQMLGQQGGKMKKVAHAVLDLYQGYLFDSLELFEI